MTKPNDSKDEHEMKNNASIQLMNAIIDIEEVAEELIPEAQGLSGTDKRIISDRLERKIEELWEIYDLFGCHEKSVGEKLHD